MRERLLVACLSTLCACLLPATLRAQVEDETPRQRMELLRLESTPVGALPRMALPMPASRDRHYWVLRGQAGYRNIDGGFDLPTVAAGVDLQWRGGSTVGVTAGYQGRDCELLGEVCGGHMLFGAQARVSLVTGGSMIRGVLGDNSATTSVGTEIGVGYAPDYIPGSPACTIDLGLPLSLAMLQTVRLKAYATPAVAWDVDCGGQGTGRASYLGAAGIGVQQLGHKGLDLYFGVQKIFRADSGVQLGLTVMYTRLPSQRIRRTP